MSDTLIDILFVVLIVAVCMLIAVFGRVYSVLGDIKNTTARIDRRSKELDEVVDRVINSFKGGIDALKGFFYSMDFVKALKKKINNYSEGEAPEEKE